MKSLLPSDNVALGISIKIPPSSLVKNISADTVQLLVIALITSGLSKKTLPERGEIITFEAPTKKFYTSSEIDTDNPVAQYENEPTNIFGKFVKYVLEIGKESYIKRVIALPGEHVEIKEGKVYINGEELNEPYLQDGVVTDVEGAGFSDFVVPENCVFAMGDNRNHSTDCRAFGCIPLEKIESTVAIRIWPLNKWGHVD